VAAELQFSLLGLLEVRRGGVLMPLAAGRQRALLAALLLRAGQVVPTGELIEVLWEDQPPPTARAGLHNCVCRLRRTLADCRHEQIVACPQGYLIRVGCGALDVTKFEVLLGEARAAAQQGSWPVAAGQARAALALWRGEPLADTGSHMLVLREAPRLIELRLQALEIAADAGLRLGQHARLVGELRGLVAEHPLHERLYALLMLALYCDGRQGEALAVYQDAYRVLAGELGIEPGPGLRELHQQILTTDPALAPARSSQPAAAGMSAVSWTLPGHGEPGSAARRANALRRHRHPRP
jgi:DNA-binding SARP family transcriptional activator